VSPLQATFDNWRREFDGHYRFGACYVLMLHPQLIGRPARVHHLDGLLSYIAEHDVWFATGCEIADWYRQSVDPAPERTG
jgi:peptidoglycan/xylan/chitin deacetylase (PgdA/CDA1 family)